MINIENIIKSKLCLGCGLCESIYLNENCVMKINENGFYEPYFTRDIYKKDKDKDIRYLCPSINFEGIDINNIWGDICCVYEGWSSDPVIRKKGASGGVISSIACYLIEKNIVDGILHVGVKSNSCFKNELQISKNKEDILNNAGSRYAPALIFNNILKILEKSNETFAFIGKPCDINVLKKLLNQYPQYSNRVKYYLSFFCAGMPSINGTYKILEKLGKENNVESVKYRGDGWPGYFEAIYNNKEKSKMSYAESWGEYLGKYIKYRCKICTDGIGLLSDIVVGDSWNSLDGYPEFNEKEGRSFVIIRNEKARLLYEKIIKEKENDVEVFSIKKLKEIQRYQYIRRKTSAYRVFPIYIMKRSIFNISISDIILGMKRSSISNGIKSMVGSIIRYKKNKYIE
jgi:coenzyme F420 hydrogenase subunit beta